MKWDVEKGEGCKRDVSISGSALTGRLRLAVGATSYALCLAWGCWVFLTFDGRLRYLSRTALDQIFYIRTRPVGADSSPSKPNDPVKVGDVGYIRSGRFHRFFNALLSAEDQTNVPESHEQLIPKSSDHIIKGSLSSDHYCSTGISVEHEPDFHASR